MWGVGCMHRYAKHQECLQAVFMRVAWHFWLERRMNAGCAPFGFFRGATACGLALAQGVAYHARGNVYDFYHALVGHAGGADYAQCAYDLPVYGVWGADYGEFFNGHGGVFAAYVDAHACGMAGFFQQVHE